MVCVFLQCIKIHVIDMICIHALVCSLVYCMHFIGILILGMLSHGQMDKASIVSDAIEYVREVSDIQADIADLEAQKEGQPKKKDIKHLNEEKMQEHKDIKHVNAKTIQKYQITAVCMPFLVECIHYRFWWPVILVCL